jgi:hypothetical protein
MPLAKLRADAQRAYERREKFGGLRRAFVQVAANTEAARRRPTVSAAPS